MASLEAVGTGLVPASRKGSMALFLRGGGRTVVEKEEGGGRFFMTDA